MFQPFLNNPIRAARRSDAEFGIDLRIVRCWYTENPDGGAGAGSSSDGTKNTDANGSSPMIPKSRFDEVNNELKTLREKVQKDSEAAQAAEQERLRKQGEFQTLAEQEKKRADDLAGKAARADALDKLIAESNAKRIANLPEARRTLVPATLPPEQVAAYLDMNWILLLGAPAPDLNQGGGGGGTTVVVTDDDRNAAEAAKAHGYEIKPEDIAKRRSEKAKK